MIALFIGMPSAGGTIDFASIAGDTVQAVKSSARKLTLVPKAAPVAGGMLTVAQYCEARGASLTVACMSRIGRKAAALSRAGGQLIGRAAQDGFGEVNSYDPAVLAQAYALIEAAP